MAESMTDELLDYEDNGQLIIKVDEQPADVKGHYWVNQAKEIVNAKQDLTLMERRVIFSLVSLVQPDDDEFKTYTIQIKDLANLLEISDGSIYDRVEKTIDQLQSKQLVLENSEVIQKITWVQSATYIKGEGRVRIKLSEDLAPYFRNLKKAFTRYRIKNVLKLQSLYSWRLYELLKEREFRKERVLLISEIRDKLRIPPDKYKMLKHLRELIENVQKELEEKTDITFTYDVHKKRGRSVESFIFNIEKNRKNLLLENEKEMASYDAENLLTMLANSGIHRKKALQLAAKYHPLLIEDNVRHAKQMNTGESIRNMAGLIVKAVEENYANSPYDIPYDDALFDLELRNVEEGIEDITRTDLDTMRTIITTYKDLSMRAARNNPETAADDMKKIGVERDDMLIKAIDNIQKRRKSHRKPPLLIEDVQSDAYMRGAYEKWEQEQPAKGWWDTPNTTG